MKSSLIIVGNSKKGTTYEEEKAFFDFYCNFKPGEEFKFKNLDVMLGAGTNLTLLEDVVIKAPDEHNSCFAIYSYTTPYGSITRNPCEIPKVMIPFDDGEEVLSRVLQYLKLKSIRE